MAHESSISTLSAFSQAMTKSINKSLNTKENNMNANFENIKEELVDFKREQTNTLDKMMVTLSNRQETFAAVSDDKMKTLETTMTQRPDASVKRKESQLNIMQK